MKLPVSGTVLRIILYNTRIFSKVYRIINKAGTGDFIKKELGVYTSSMETIYPYLRAQVSVGTFFMKSLVVGKLGCRVVFLKYLSIHNGME